MRYLVLAAIGSLRVWIAWMVGGLDESMLDMVPFDDRLLFTLGVDCYLGVFEIVNNFCGTTPLEVMAVFSWPPLEVGLGYLTGPADCLGMTGVGCGNTLCASAGKYLTFRQFANIFLTASIVSNCESHMLVGTSLSAADKKCMEWVILSYAIMWGCVRY